jgi:hypothetical protein
VYRRARAQCIRRSTIHLVVIQRNLAALPLAQSIRAQLRDLRRAKCGGCGWNRTNQCALSNRHLVCRVPTQGEHHTATGCRADCCCDECNANRAHQAWRGSKTSPFWMKIHALRHFLTYKSHVWLHINSNRRLKFKQSFETGVSLKQGFFVTSARLLRLWLMRCANPIRSPKRGDTLGAGSCQGGGFFLPR